MDLQDYDIRDILNVSENVYLHKEKFLPKHAALVRLNEQIIEYYINNAEELFNILHPSTIQKIEEEEEDWDCVEKCSEPMHKPTNQMVDQEEEDNIEPTEEEEYLNSPEFFENVRKENAENALNLKIQVANLMHQSESDQLAAKVLKHHGCLAQSIFYFQQSSEKGLKALWLQQGDPDWKVKSDAFKSHDLVALAQIVQRHSEMHAGNFELVSHARSMEAIAQNSSDCRRSLCLRARYAKASRDILNTQPWFVFNTNHVNSAYEHSNEILKYCVKTIGQKIVSGPCSYII